MASSCVSEPPPAFGHEGTPFWLNGVWHKWLKDRKFAFTAVPQPSKLADRALCHTVGRRIFEDKMARFIRPRRCQPTQQIKWLPGRIGLTIKARGRVELASWVLGVHDEAEVIELQAMCEQLAAELEHAARYHSVFSTSATTGAPTELRGSDENCSQR